MCVASCSKCKKKFVVSKVPQRWERNCPNCHGKLLREEEHHREPLAKRVRDALQLGLQVLDKQKGGDGY